MERSISLNIFCGYIGLWSVIVNAFPFNWNDRHRERRELTNAARIPSSYRFLTHFQDICACPKQDLLLWNTFRTTTRRNKWGRNMDSQVCLCFIVFWHIVVVRYLQFTTVSIKNNNFVLWECAFKHSTSFGIQSIWIRFLQWFNDSISIAIFCLAESANMNHLDCLSNIFFGLLFLDS